MKKIRVVALAMVLVMLALCVASCGVEKVKVNCTVTIVANGETYLENYAYTVENTVETPPTVLQAVTEVCTVVDFPYEVDDAGNSLTCITLDGVEYRSGTQADGSGQGFWGYTLDGVEPSSGRAGTNTVAEGQSIVFTFNVDGQGAVEFTDAE